MFRAYACPSPKKSLIVVADSALTVALAFAVALISFSATTKDALLNSINAFCPTKLYGYFLSPLKEAPKLEFEIFDVAFAVAIDVKFAFSVVTTITAPSSISFPDHVCTNVGTTQ